MDPASCDCSRCGDEAEYTALDKAGMLLLPERLAKSFATEVPDYIQARIRNIQRAFDQEYSNLP